ncbi:hypothetical protein [Lacinutrix sp. MEBiC02404]
MKTLILKIFLFSILISVIVYNVDGYFVKDDPAFEKYKFYNEKEKNTVDVLFLGNSHLANGVNTKIINAKCKLSSYNLGLRATNIFHTYYNLVEALKNQKPKLVVIENFTFLENAAESEFLNEEGKMFVKNYGAIHAKKPGLNKFEEINLAYKENKLYNFFNLFRGHENWSDLENQSKVLYKYTSSNFKDKDYKDHYQSLKILRKERASKIDNLKIKDTINISKDQEVFIERIIKLSQEHDFELLFVTIPFYNNYYAKIEDQLKQVNKKLNAIIKEHNNVKFLDLNTMSDFSRTYFLDEKPSRNQHLNYKGGIKATNILANYVNKEYNFNLNKVNRLKPESFVYNKKAIDTLIEKGRILSNLERINGLKDKKFSLRQGKSSIVFEGWMVIENQESKFNELFIALEKNEDFILVRQMNNRKIRKDVSKFFKKEAIYDHSGFKLEIESELLEKGNYSISLIIRDENGKVLVKPVKNKIKIL